MSTTTSTAISVADEAAMHQAAGATRTEFILSMNNINAFDLGQQDQPVTHAPPEHLRVHNVQRQSAPSTSSVQYVSTPGPVVQDITSASSINNGLYLVDLDINMVNREFLDEIPAAV